MKVGLIGAGSMGSALARGLGQPVLVTDAVPARARELAGELGGRAFDSNADLAAAVDLVVLCHKPAQLEEVAQQTGGHARAIASLVAATPIAALEQVYPGIPVYRFIPNIPVEVRRGVLCYAPGTRAAEGPEQEVLALFGAAGMVIQLAEPLIEPAMALMSSGPAFMALAAETLADAGARHGLDRREAILMTVETMAGTAEYLRARDLDAASLRARVATPGGVTERGLQALERGGLREAFQDAVDEVVRKATA